MELRPNEISIMQELLSTHAVREFYGAEQVSRIFAKLSEMYQDALNAIPPEEFD